jgi:hypothetical protein
VITPPVPGGDEAVPCQRAGFAVGADHRDGAACLVEQVADLAEITDAVLA